VVDLVEARFDVPFEHPVVIVGRVEEDLFDGVLSPAPRTEAVTARRKTRLEYRLQYQLEGGLHGPVACGGDTQAPEPASFLRYEFLPHGQGDEPTGLEVFSQPVEEHLLAKDDGAGCHPIDPLGPCSLVVTYPVPRHH
jgi:hypothetical protein